MAGGITIRDKKILITGGAGFIGSNLAEILLKDNEVTVLDNLSTGRKSNLDDLYVDFMQGSITDLELVKKLCKGMDCVFHIGALPSVPRSIEDPELVHNVNVNGTLNVLMAARDCGVGKVVFAASSSAYGDSPTLPKVESMPPSPLSPYAVTKLAGEYYCKVFYEVYGLPTASVRYFNVYGPKQDPGSDYAAVIPIFVSRLRNNQPPIIYGDGEQTRDFTYVKDTVNGTILAAESERANGEIINIAGGRRISLNELASRLKNILGVDIENEYAEERPGDVKHSLADISKAERLMNYRPVHALDEGLAETVEYMRGDRARP